jgi:Protein of unknown function (DUF3054)
MQVWPAIAVDVICILVFAIVGRSSHNESTDLLGIVHTTWPFLIGAIAGMIAGRIWRRPTAVATGVFVWLGALVVGMALRFVSGGGVQLSFVIVAGCVLAVFLIGWRAALKLIRRAVPSSAG